MTTIATDGKTFSVDSQQASTRFVDQFDALKIFRIDGIVYGYAGCFSSWLGHKEWVENGRPKDDKPKLESDWSVIFVKNNQCYWEDFSLIPVKSGLPQAIGTGGAAAMGAMLAGASPSQAVKIAMKLDPDTGGKIRTMKC